jgi:hypothetical protein
MSVNATEAGNTDTTRRHRRGPAVMPGLARQLVVPQGFTLSTTGVFAIQLGHHAHPDPVTIWLFVVGAGLGAGLIVAVSGAHRSASTPLSITGYQLFNLVPVVVVPAVSVIAWWIPNPPLAFLTAGLITSCGYLAALTLFVLTLRLIGR